MRGFINEFDIPKKNIPDCKSSLSCEIDYNYNHYKWKYFR